MRKFLVNVNGTSYEVEVEEINGEAAPAAASAPACPPPTMITSNFMKVYPFV